MAAIPEDFSARLRQVEMAALSATQRIESHEEICAERYGHIKDSIRSVRSTLTWAATTLIVGMGGILVKLVFFPSGG